LGVLAFSFWVFLVSFFREIEEKNKFNPEAKDQSFFELADFESIRIVEKSKEEDNIVDFLKNLSSSFLVQFIIARINPPETFWPKLVASLSSSNFSENLDSIIREAIKFIAQEGYSILTPADIFYGLLKSSKDFPSLLFSCNLKEDDLKNIIFWGKSFSEKIKSSKGLIEKLKSFNLHLAEDWVSGYTNTLDRFSFDLTNPRFFGTFSVEGRDQILQSIENILTKEARNNCLLVGKNGVGKTTIVYKFAEKVYWGEVDPDLAYKRVVFLDTRYLLTSTRNPKEAEFYLALVLEEAAAAGNVILFIDEIQNLLSGGRPGSINAGEILIRYLEDPRLRIIATANEDDFTTYIQPKETILANFEVVPVEELDENNTIKILEKVSLYYSLKNQIQITYNALKEIYKLAGRFITHKGFPAKAVDFLDSISSQAKGLGISLLDKAAVLKIAEKIFRVPLSEVVGEEKDKLLNLEKLIHQRIIDQEEAVQAVSDALRRARAASKESKKPIGSFLFLGPTGVGKTELSKALAEIWFGSENSIIRMDMSEYQDEEAVYRFIGKKIIGQRELEGGEFVKKVKNQPYSVVLLDEIEKASRDILNLFLQVLDEGYLTSGMGEKVYFSNTIIIATSNAGANLIREGVKNEVPYQKLKEDLLNYLLKNDIFSPEFLNRFDGVVLFKPLDQEALLRIAQLFFTKLQKDFQEQGYLIEIEKEVLEKIVEIAFKPEFGAREMKRVFQDKIENFLARKILENQLKKGEKFTISLQDIQ